MELGFASEASFAVSDGSLHLSECHRPIPMSLDEHGVKGQIKPIEIGNLVDTLISRCFGQFKRNDRRSSSTHSVTVEFLMRLRRLRIF